MPVPKTENELKAQRIVDLIVHDLKDRRGLRQEWEQIDSDIQAEIRDRWEAIALATIDDPKQV